MKAFTDINQSKKLAEILPVESADGFYEAQHNHLTDKWEYILFTDNKWASEEVVIPCWSLATLLDLLPSTIKRKEKTMFLTLEKAGAYNLYYKSPDRLDELWFTKDDIIDAVVEMILTLPEEKLYSYGRYN